MEHYRELAKKTDTSVRDMLEGVSVEGLSHDDLSEMFSLVDTVTENQAKKDKERAVREKLVSLQKK